MVKQTIFRASFGIFNSIVNVLTPANFKVLGNGIKQNYLAYITFSHSKLFEIEL